jgi:hypothetical protein
MLRVNLFVYATKLNFNFSVLVCYNFHYKYVLSNTPSITDGQFLVRQ